MTLEQLMWLFPIVFMFHEFEEIILIPWWLQRNRQRLEMRFWVFGHQILAHYRELTQSGFALIVAEEFALVAFITVVGTVGGQYLLFAGMLVAFLLHLVVHMVQAVVWGGYTPMIVTSVLAAPYCVYVLVVLGREQQLGTLPIVAASLGMSVLVALNLMGMNRVVKGVHLFEEDNAF